MINNQQVGRNMMLLRLQKGLSQQGLAEMCNVTHQAVSKRETGAALPDMQTLLFLSKYFGTSMEDILSGDISLDVQDTAPDLTDAETLPAMTATEMPSALEAPPVREENIPVMGWDQIIDLAPFASRETLETHAEHCQEALDKERLCDLAPFLSSAYLDKLVRRMGTAGPELALELAPFLSRKTVDWLLCGQN
ncbi:MAG: helix-turn-helix transcriptional regulator [Clostridia bacterium]|nr:helix-turn-helix transcriptional regulator [Clostridia bacterium]